MKKILSFILSAMMVVSCLTALAPTSFAADAPAFSGKYLYYEAESGNGMAKGTADSLKGVTGYVYTEDINVESFEAGAYIGIWVGKSANYIVGYDFDTQQFMAAKKKLTAAGGFNTSDIIGKKAYTIKEGTDYRIAIAVSAGKVEFFVNGESILTATDTVIVASAMFVSYHSGMNAKIDNFSVKDSSGKALVSLDFEEAEDFDQNGWDFTISSGFTIPGIVDRPTPIDGDYMLYIDASWAYMQTVKSPYDAAGWSMDFDVCPIDTTASIDPETEGAYVGVSFSTGEGNYGWMMKYDFTLQQFKICNDWFATSLSNNGDTVYASADFKWDDFETAGVYTWHKISFRTFMGTAAIYCDGKLMCSYKDEQNEFIKANTDVIIPYTYGSYYIDNWNVGGSFAYDPVNGKGKKMCSEDFNTGDINTFNDNVDFLCSFGSVAKVIQADTLIVDKAKDNFSPDKAPDPEVKIDRKVLYSPVKAKYIDSQQFVIPGEYVTSMDFAPIAPLSDTMGIFGYKFGAGNKRYLGYDMLAKKIIIGEWTNDDTGVQNISSEYAFDWAIGEWHNLGFRLVGSTIKVYLDNKLIIEASDNSFISDSGAKVVLYSLAELYMDNWLLADGTYDLENNCGIVTYEITFDTDNYDDVKSGIGSAMVGVTRKIAACKKADPEAPYGCNIKLEACTPEMFRYTCQYCGESHVYDKEGKEVPAVVPFDGVMGDVNGDGQYNAKDVNAVMKVLAGVAGVEVDEIAADVNGDKAVNAKDVALMLKLSAGWNVIFVIPVVVNDLSFEGFTYDFPVVGSIAKERIDNGAQKQARSVHKEGTSFALKFDVAKDEYLQAIEIINAPSWSDSYGGMRASFYKWDTDFATTVKGEELAYEELVDYDDNTSITIFHCNQKSCLDERFTNTTMLVVFTGIPSKVNPEADIGIGTWEAGTVKDSRYTYFVNGEVLGENLIAMSQAIYAYPAK